VIITRNRAAELLRTLGRLASLPERPPVIVVDNGSTDGTPERVAREFPAVTVFALGRNAGAAGRTAGVRAAVTPYVAFADDDSWWAPGALPRAADVLDAHPRVALVAARVLVGVEQRVDPVCALMAASPLPRREGTPGPRVLGFVACGAVVRRAAYLEAGGFHPRAGVGGEEALLAADLAGGGWDLVYRDDIVAHHHPSLLRDVGARRARELRNDLWFAWRRRRPAGAVAETRRVLRIAAGDPRARRGVLAAVRGLPHVLAERAPVSRPLERDLARLGR
jgi:GT2 family glycosyltransferase